MLIVRYIVLHAGTKDGFVEGASLVFSTSQRANQLRDYHGEMNAENFEKWFEHQLLPNLKQPAAIIMDNAPYHSALIEKNPTSAWKKAEIVEWLQHHDIPFETDMLKPQLLQIVTR